MKRFVIERIEENCVVLECENGSHVTIERKSLPKRIKDGDVLFFGEGSYFLDEKETEQIAAGPFCEITNKLPAVIRRQREKQRFFREIEIADFGKFAVTRKEVFRNNIQFYLA